MMFLRMYEDQKQVYNWVSKLRKKSKIFAAACPRFTIENWTTSELREYANEIKMNKDILSECTKK